MKSTTILVALVASGAVAYHGYSLQQATQTASSKADTIIAVVKAESEKWQAESTQWKVETDRLHKRLDGLPQTVADAVKAGSRQATKEIVGAPAEAGKTVVKNVEATVRDAGRDTKAEANRAIKKAGLPFRL